MVDTINSQIGFQVSPAIREETLQGYENVFVFQMEQQSGNVTALNTSMNLCGSNGIRKINWETVNTITYDEIVTTWHYWNIRYTFTATPINYQNFLEGNYTRTATSMEQFNVVSYVV